MGRHKQSENMNDDSRLSVVLGMYNMLKLHDWEKLRQNITGLTNKDGSSMIKVCLCPFSQSDSYQINMV